MSWLTEIEHRVNTSIFRYRDPNVGLANAGHTMQSRYMVAKGGLTAASFVVGGGVVTTVATKTKGVRTGLSWVRNPALMYVANFGRTNLQRSLARGALGVGKAVRYVNYGAFIASPFMTYRYYKKGEYDKAIINWFGPPGSVWVYNRAEKMFEKEPSRQKYSQTGMPTNQPRVVKSKKMSEAQKMRLWRMGLRWCKTHRRYDRCSLRER